VTSRDVTIGFWGDQWPPVVGGLLAEQVRGQDETRRGYLVRNDVDREVVDAARANRTARLRRHTADERHGASPAANSPAISADPTSKAPRPDPGEQGVHHWRQDHQGDKQEHQAEQDRRGHGANLGSEVPMVNCTY
jgi:hypothetical protein